MITTLGKRELGFSLLHKKAVSHLINSRALTGEMPCINKAIHALLMNENSLRKLRSRDIGEKAKLSSARNNAKCSKCFQFLCNNSDKLGFSMH